jgi:hypothetical protein
LRLSATPGAFSVAVFRNRDVAVSRNAPLLLSATDSVFCDVVFYL